MEKFNFDCCRHLADAKVSVTATNTISGSVAAVAVGAAVNKSFDEFHSRVNYRFAAIIYENQMELVFFFSLQIETNFE